MSTRPPRVPQYHRLTSNSAVRPVAAYRAIPAPGGRFEALPNACEHHVPKRSSTKLRLTNWQTLRYSIVFLHFLDVSKCLPICFERTFSSILWLGSIGGSWFSGEDCWKCLHFYMLCCSNWRYPKSIWFVKKYLNVALYYGTISYNIPMVEDVS